MNVVTAFLTRRHFIIYLSLLFWGFVAYTADPRGNQQLIFLVTPVALVVLLALTAWEFYMTGRRAEAKLHFVAPEEGKVDAKVNG